MVNQALRALLASGLSVIPTREDKRPAVESWQAFQGRRPTVEESADWAASYGLGVICGPVNGGLFCIDVDSKNAPEGMLLTREFVDLVREQAPDLITSLVVETTPSGGAHFIGRCKTPVRNLKLARTKDHKVLIETRGDGGYFCAAPTPEYKLVQGGLDKIPEVTAEEMEILLDCARAFNQEEKEPARIPRTLSGALTPLDDYDRRTTPEETVQLLESHGWKVVSRKRDAFYLLRPEKTGRGISATFNHVPGRFYVFTTSTVFDSEHVYKPYAVYAMLEHGGNFQAAAKALAALGYGEKKEAKAAPAVEAPELVRRMLALYQGGMRAGVSPGWPNLAKHYQVVKGQLTIITGTPSHGKSELADAIMVNLAIAHKWRFMVFSPENYPVEIHARKIAEKVKGLPMFGPNRFTLSDCVDMGHWVNEHFTFIDGQDEDVDLDAIFERILEEKKVRRVDGFLIDPWNELESARPEKMSETEYIGLCLKRSRIFARKHDLCAWIVAHPTKQYKDKNTGEYPIPTLYDISGSAHWYNKADNGITVHRDLAANLTRIIVQKVKFKYYGKPGEVAMKYDPYSGRYTEMANADHFKPEHNRQTPTGDE